MNKPHGLPPSISRITSIAAAAFAALLLALVQPLAASAAPAAAAEGSLFNLAQLVELAKAHHAGLGAARQQVRSAEAGVVTAGALPNPEIEILSGSQRARAIGTGEGSTRSLSITQRLDLPGLRTARIDAARSGLVAEQSQLRATERELVRVLRLHYYDLLRRQAEWDAAEQDLVTSTQIHERVSVRVKSGEAARYDIIKADAELLNAQKQVQGARLRVAQARASLRRAVGAPLPSQFDVLPDTDPLPDLQQLERLQQEALASNPELARDRALVQRARQQVTLERNARLPSFALRAGFDQDPEARGARVGVIVSVPLWDRRAGPIADASAQLARTELEQQQREFNLRQSLEAASHQYAISHNQIAALESGILRQAEAALRIAEAAYRFGERGILDYLDAQRVYRNARNELIAARYDLRAAQAEIERLYRP